MGWCEHFSETETAHEGTLAGEGTAIQFNSTDTSEAPPMCKALREAGTGQALPLRTYPAGIPHVPGSWYQGGGSLGHAR